MYQEGEQVAKSDAAQQVRTAVIRLALMHIAYARTLVNELGPERGKELIIKAIMEYGRLVGERIREGHQDLPDYGLHDKYSYAGKEYFDRRERPEPANGKLDFSQYAVFGCVLAKIFAEYGEEDLGSLYCYVDPAKTMSSNPTQKMIHTACELLGDTHCAFDIVPTTPKEREEFVAKDPDWKTVDPILLKGNTK